MPAVPDFQIPSWQPGIKDPMHAYDFGQLAPALRPTAANLENLLRKALATTTPDEICFVYFPPEEISFSPETGAHRRLHIRLASNHELKRTVTD